MPGWLARSVHARSAELVAEFFRLSGSAAAEETFRPACELLRQLFDAEAVVLWRLAPTGQRLEPVAASTQEWEFFVDVSLEVYPVWEDALRGPGSLWVEEPARLERLVPTQLLEDRRVLLVPTTAHSRPYGCFLVVFPRNASAPSAEEQEAAGVLATSLGLWLEAETAREQAAAGRERSEARRRLEAELHRQGSPEALLNRLVAAGVELGAVVAGVYEYRRGRLTRVAGAGANHLLPAKLPFRETSPFPWQEAMAGGMPVEVVSGDGLAESASWLAPLLPEAAPVRFWPLVTAESSLGVLLVGGGSVQDDDRPFLCLLATAALEQRRWRRLEECSRQRFQGLFEHAPLGFLFLDAGGRLLAASPAFLEDSGYAWTALEHRSVTEFLHPDDAAPVVAWLESRSEAQGQTPAGPSRARWRLQSGDWRECELRLQALPGAAGGPESGEEAEEPAALLWIRPAPPSSDREDRLAEQEARWQALLDSVQDGVWILGLDQKVEFANHRLSQLFGVRPAQLAPGLTQTEALEWLRAHFEDPEAALARWEQLQGNPEQVCWDELELKRPRRRVLERFARPLLDANQRLVGRLELYRDITSKRLLEDKVLQREKLAAVGQLVSGIAHELNNPLTAVTGTAQLMLAGSLPAHLREKVERLGREAERAARIVRNLLLFARGGGAEKQNLRLEDILERTLALRAYELKVENVRVERQFAPGLPPVYGDAHQLQQVFLNILLNAEQAIRSHRDHGRIVVRATGPTADGRVRVEISDDGPGIPPDLLPYIFDPFLTTKSPADGTGLGLYISQTIVSEHGGEIGAENAAGGGATFIVELPARPRAEVAAPEPVAARRPARRSAKKTQRILVVDDELAVADLIADALEKEGYTVSVHTESQRALAEALGHPFDLAICDIRMPELDGPAFYRILCHQQSPLAHRLLFTTGDTLTRETAAFLQEVRAPFLPKPFHVEELQETVRGLLNHEEHSPRASVSIPNNAEAKP